VQKYFKPDVVVANFVHKYFYTYSVCSKLCAKKIIPDVMVANFVQKYFYT
jgi:uncharacterized metal-binding protein